jgi:hypothetical protein
MPVIKTHEGPFAIASALVKSLMNVLLKNIKTILIQCQVPKKNVKKHHISKSTEEHHKPP